MRHIFKTVVNKDLFCEEIKSDKDDPLPMMIIIRKNVVTLTV